MTDGLLEGSSVTAVAATPRTGAGDVPWLTEGHPGPCWNVAMAPEEEEGKATSPVHVAGTDPWGVTGKQGGAANSCGILGIGTGVAEPSCGVRGSCGG